MKYKINIEEMRIPDGVYETKILTTLVQAGILIPVPEKEWPKNGDIYYCVSSTGKINSDNWLDDTADDFRRRIGNIFHTKKEAQAYKDSLLNEG